MSLSILIPVFNEKKTIETVIKKVMEFKDLNMEIIVVDDGSIDDTEEIIENLAKKNNIINFVKHSNNKGKGAALRAGLQYIKNKSEGKKISIKDAFIAVYCFIKYSFFSK